MGRPRGSTVVDETKIPKEIQGCLKFFRGLGRSEATLKGLRETLFVYLKFCMNPSPESKLKPTDRLDRTTWAHVQGFRNSIMNNGIKKSAVVVYIRRVRMYYLYRAKSNLNNQKLFNLYQKVMLVDVPKVRGHKHYEAIDLDDVRLLLKKTEEADYELYAFLMTLLYSGGRAAFYGMKKNNVDFEHEKIVIKVKGGEIIPIPLHPDLAKVLKNHLETRDYDLDFFFRLGRETDTLNGERGNSLNAWTYCKKAGEIAGLKYNPNPHRWRETLSQHGRKLGLDPQYIQVVLGHRSIKTTLDSYARPDFDEAAKALSKISFTKDKQQSEEDVCAQLDTIVDLVPNNIKKPIASMVKGMKELIIAANGGG